MEVKVTAKDVPKKGFETSWTVEMSMEELKEYIENAATSENCVEYVPGISWVDMLLGNQKG